MDLTLRQARPTNDLPRWGTSPTRDLLRFVGAGPYRRMSRHRGLLRLRRLGRGRRTRRASREISPRPRLRDPMPEPSPPTSRSLPVDRSRLAARPSPVAPPGAGLREVGAWAFPRYRVPLDVTTRISTSAT